MEALYDRTDIYDLFESKEKDAATRRHWELVLSDKDIHSLLDVSIGTGSLTLPLAELGVTLAGSDLSETMLRGCQKKAEARGIPITLQCSDFRKLDQAFSEQFDCVASTGNSLPYVPNREVPSVLAQMDRRVKPGGYLYVDLRNWDKILRGHQRFFLYNPQFRGDTRINLVQVWDHPDEESIIFNLLFTFERDNRIVQKEIFQEHYYPVRRTLLLEALEKLGYQDIQVGTHPAQFDYIPLENADWYYIIGKKPESSIFF